jgi:2,4-dienoyl-CoA reductase-like NADH-dependent reductase (Old Yellow Enzyme family)
MDSVLFSPLKLRGLQLDNRIVVSPMCQYSAVDGTPSDWHLMHLGQYAVSGVGLVLTEATGVGPKGRISPWCPGLYSDANEAGFRRVIDFAREYGNAPVGIQLAHAGRKAGTDAPWNGQKPVMPENGGWIPVGPSAIPFSNSSHMPEALDAAGIEAVQAEFVAATQRADRVGFDCIELHAAHGYLMHSFLSPISNRRDDDYGGSRENRMRMLLETFDKIRKAWPKEKPIGVRISAIDWLDDGWQLDDSIALAKELDNRGCDYIVASSGGTAPDALIQAGPGYQTGFAAAIRRAVKDVKVMTVGMISDPIQAESIVRSGQADLVALGRRMLYNPHWTWEAAVALGQEAKYPHQYARCHPKLAGLPVPPGRTPTSA